MKGVKNETINVLWKNMNKRKTFVVYFLVLKNISLTKFCHIVICPANALTSWICCINLRDFLYNNTFDTCWKRNTKEVTQLTLYAKSCCGINDDILQQDDGVIITAATKIALYELQKNI